MNPRTPRIRRERYLIRGILVVGIIVGYLVAHYANVWCTPVHPCAVGAQDLQIIGVALLSTCADALILLWLLPGALGIERKIEGRDPNE